MSSLHTPITIGGCVIRNRLYRAPVLEGAGERPDGADVYRRAFEENARAVIDTVHKARPHSIKGTYIHTCTLSATMSPPVRVDIKEFATH
jgi:hypothetical protein